ncbi:MAG: vWA domain-containing protein [Clostridia bacterium]
MKNEVFFILDRSGSMSGIESDTIGGYNTFLEKQRKDGMATSITTVLFDDKYEVLHSVCDIREVTNITSEEYFVRGSTALLDAIGKTIITAKKRILAQRKSEQPDNVIFVIITDGYENASTKYTYSSIRDLIALQESEHKWEFLFLGADLGSTEDADRMGIKMCNRVTYNKADTGAMFETMALHVSEFKQNGIMREDWVKDIEDL